MQQNNYKCKIKTAKYNKTKFVMQGFVALEMLSAAFVLSPQSCTQPYIHDEPD